MFGYGQQGSADTQNVDKENNNEDKTNLTTGHIDNGDDSVDIDKINTTTDTTNVNNNSSENKLDKNNNDNSNNNEEIKLEKGYTIELEDKVYTVDENGNLLDENGNIFKEAKDVNDWLKEFDKIDNDEDISIKSIQNAIGITITDENDKPIEFENNINGIKDYINSVIESSKEEQFEAAINTLYEKYPILEDVLNYYIANGNSLQGFNDIPDRSQVVFDENNEAQHEAIIQTAWSEQGRKGDVNGYIQYLKSSGTLAAVAKEELAALQEADANYRKQIEEEADRKEQERIKNIEEYWNGVHNAIKSRTLAGYQIPESIIIERNNQKITATPEDFFNYVYLVDKQGMSAYQRDLLNETPESRRDDELLRAYLKFVGGNYSNLVNMAINKEKVNSLKLRAKERRTSPIKINKPTNSDANKGINVDLGYN